MVELGVADQRHGGDGIDQVAVVMEELVDHPGALAVASQHDREAGADVHLGSDCLLEGTDALGHVVADQAAQRLLAEQLGEADLGVVHAEPAHIGVRVLLLHLGLKVVVEYLVNGGPHVVAAGGIFPYAVDADE